MERTLTDTIREITKTHIDENDGVVMGQCLSAVGWVQHTVPAQEKGIVELPMTDIAGAGFAVGAALMGRRPIFILRFQSFLWLNISPLVNHAAKAKEMFGYSAPVFTRCIASEGGGQGPVHSNCYHSLVMHMPGMPVVAPMSPGEYEEIWQHYITHDDPMFVSEHRSSYRNTQEMEDQIEPEAEVTLVAMSASRFHAVEAASRLRAEGIKCNLIHVVWLKPFKMSEEAKAALKNSGCGLVFDSAYEIAGASQSIAYDLMFELGCPVKAVAQADYSPGAAVHLENGTPDADRMVKEAKEIIGRKKN